MAKTSNRLPYLDWMRGLGVLIMLQGHVLESWVRPQDRSGEWFRMSQFLGGLPAPIFLFLVGVSLALVLDRMRSKGASTAQLCSKVLRRSGWILFLAYAFRFEQYVMWYPASKGTDVFRVDTLNCIAICTLIVGLLSLAFRSRRTNLAAMTATTVAFVFLTPWIYPTKGLPAFILSYFNGGGHSWYFGFFPWAAFAFAGITFGYALLAGKERMGEAEFFKWVGVAGVGLYAVGRGMSLSPVFQYGFFDYSLTSPHFFFVRLGWVLLILYGAYSWSTLWSTRQPQRWSPLISLGQASLVIYWVHIEIVYGRILHPFSQALEVTTASMQVLWLVPLMLVLASRKQIQAAVMGMRASRARLPELSS